MRRLIGIVLCLAGSSGCSTLAELLPSAPAAATAAPVAPTARLVRPSGAARIVAAPAAVRDVETASPGERARGNDVGRWLLLGLAVVVAASAFNAFVLVRVVAALRRFRAGSERRPVPGRGRRTVRLPGIGRSRTPAAPPMPLLHGAAGDADATSEAPAVPVARLSHSRIGSMREYYIVESR